MLALKPSTITNAGAQIYDNQYKYDNNHQKKGSHADKQKIKCVNSNINVNGIDVTQIPTDDLATAEAANEGGADATGAQNGKGWGDGINFDRNLVNVCVNVNDNEQINVSPPPDKDGSPCEDCFSCLTETQIGRLLSIVQATSIGAYCERLLLTPDSCGETDSVFFALEDVLGPDGIQIADISDCLVDADVIDPICV